MFNGEKLKEIHAPNHTMNHMIVWQIDLPINWTSSMPWKFSSGSKKKKLVSVAVVLYVLYIKADTKSWMYLVALLVPIAPQLLLAYIHRSYNRLLTIEALRFHGFLNTWTKLWSNVLKIGNERIYNQYKIKEGIFFERIAKVFALPCTDSAALICVHIEHMSC